MKIRGLHMFGMLLYKRRLVSLLTVIVVVTPVVFFGISRMMSMNPTKASAYTIPEGYETFKDATLYGCVARAYEYAANETVPSDGLTDEQLASITSLYCRGDNLSEDEKISDTTGIEKLTGLTILYLGRNKISEIDLSKNVQLTTVDLSVNQLTELDVTKNINLDDLTIEYNEIESIDLSQNHMLSALTVNHNRLTELNVSQNTSLAALKLHSNEVEALDLTNNALLRVLNIGNNKVSEIDLSNNTLLRVLDIGGNEVSEIDLSNNTDLEHLDVAYNLLVGELDVSRNTQLKTIIASTNQIDNLDVSKNVFLEELDLDGNRLLDNLDVSHNTKLKTLKIRGCNISELDLSNNLDLEYLSAGDELNSLDVSQNTKLTYLNYGAEKFSAVDTSNNLLLRELWARGRALSALDLSHNTALEHLVVGDYDYSVLVNEIDITHNDLLKTIYNPSNLPVRADIDYSFEGDDVVFDFSKLGFISSIEDTAFYSYDTENKKLVVSDLDLTHGYAKVNAHAYSNATAVWSFSKLILSDFVLTLNGGSEDTGSLVCLPENKSGTSCVVVLPELSSFYVDNNTEKRFLGWADSAGVIEPQYMANEEMTLTGRKTVYAVWQDVYTYTLNYNLNSGDASADGIESISCTTTGESCGVAITNVRPSREGYVFLGWADTADANEGNNNYVAGANIVLTEDKTLYAIWAPIFTLSFNTNGGDGSVLSQTCNPTTTNGSCAVTIPRDAEVNREGYWWLGWSSDPSSSVPEKQSGDIVTLTNSTTLYAVWEEVVRYVLSFDLNGGVGSADNLMCTVASGETSCIVTLTGIIADNLSREGYVFLGWAGTADANEGNNSYAAGASITLTSNKTIYAIWAPVYTLNFEVGESKTLIEKQTCYPNTTDGTCEVIISKISPTLDGYEFVGWAKAENSAIADYRPNEKYSFTKGDYNETLYAIFKEEEKEPEIKVPDTGDEMYGSNNGANVIMIAILPMVGIIFMARIAIRKYYVIKKW